MSNQNEYSNAHGHGKEKLKKGWHLFKKYNPALALARNGFLILIKDLNAFGIATRTYPAFLTPAEAQAKHFKVSSIEPAKKWLEQLHKFYEKVGGASTAVDNAVKKGSRHRIKKLQKKLGADGIAEWSSEKFSNLIYPATWTAISAGTTLLATALAMLNKSGADKNPFEAGSDAANKFDKDHADGGTPPAADSAAQAELEKKAQEDKDKGLGLDDGSNTIWWVVGGLGAVALIGVGIWYYKTHKTA